jgi:hypothetical protein
MTEPLSAEDIETIRKTIDNLGMVYWKEILIHYHLPARNHIISKDALRKAVADLKTVVERWV